MQRLTAQNRELQTQIEDMLHRFEEMDEQIRELYFKVVSEIIDGAVPDLAPDLFRMVDINDDGTITAEEWAKCKNVIKNPEPRAVIGLLFKLLVCFYMMHIHIYMYVYVSDGVCLHE